MRLRGYDGAAVFFKKIIEIPVDRRRSLRYKRTKKIHKVQL